MKFKAGMLLKTMGFMEMNPVTELVWELARQADLACDFGSSAARFVPRFPALGFTIFPEPDCDRTGAILRDVSFGRRMPVCDGLSRP